ncbi:5'-nucleotidase C-terminal domain-containing protein [Escherichia coli]
MKLLQRGVALALLTTFTLASETALAYEQDKTYKITVLHTNDHHGHFWRNEYGEYGLAAQKTLVDGIRKEVAAEGGSVLLLSGGDINTGVPESDLQDAEPDFRGMNLVGYDAMAIGNHEFDNPLTVLRQQEKWAKFPLLSANIYQKSTGERLFKPWALFKRQDLKIAVIGLTTDDTAKIGNPEYFTDIEFRKPADEAKLVILAAQMDRTGADFAVMSGGGIRDSIEAGDISYKNVLKVQPFGNVVVYADMTGKEVIDYLTAVAQMKPDSGAYPQFANVSFVAKDGKLNDLKIKGEPVDPAKTYRMATLNFNATGGDGYPRLDNKPGYVNTGFIDAEVLKAYIQKSSPLDVSVYEPKGEVSWQ